jgi:tryptophanyl-tRNA synthetase
MYKADAVPVGEDQVPHVELTREVARRFNTMYALIDETLFDTGNRHHLKRVLDEFDFHWSVDPEDALKFTALSKEAAERTYLRSIRAGIQQIGLPLIQRSIDYGNQGHLVANGPSRLFSGVFPEPQALLTPSPRLPGTDGRKMSKSYNNAIFLTDPPDVVSRRLTGYMTDPARKRRTDPGNPDVCPVFDLHKVFSPKEVVDRVNRECRTAEIGCVECKQLAAQHLNNFLAPIQQRRKPYEENPRLVWDVLEEGTARARTVAQATMAEVRAAVMLT